MTYEVYDTYEFAVELRLLAPQKSALFAPLNSRLCDRQKSLKYRGGLQKVDLWLFFGPDLAQIGV
jgi:hypothetical protein